MPVKFVGQVPFQERTRGTLMIDGTTGYTEEQLWQVIVDIDEAMSWTPTGAVQVAGIPRVGDLHFIYPQQLRCREVTAARDENAPQKFNVRVVYGPRPENDSKANGKWYIKLKVAGVERSEDLHNDLLTGLPIVNSTGDPFDPPRRVIYYDEAISVDYNSFEVDWDQIKSLRGRVNTAEVDMTVYGQKRIFPPKTLKLAKADYETTVGDGIQFYHVQLILHCRSQLDKDGNEIGWTAQLVDRGFNVKNPNYDPSSSSSGAADRFIPAKDAHGDPRTTQAFLDGHGNELKPNTDGSMPKCVLLPFNENLQADLNPLLTGIS